MKMRTEGDLIEKNEWLRPLSWLYGAGVRLRNWCFDIGLLKSRAFDVPVIAVGNITVGGSGKTPHTEYLIRLLSQMVQVAVLSRGYKRKSRGYVLADDSTPMSQIGDEPFQMKHKFPGVYVAVDKKRVHGIERLTHDEATKDVDVILLDDAFQHRYVKPGINILLVDYHRLIIYDELLPCGRLREPLSGKNRADMVIVTKCPKDLRPMEYRVLTKALDLFPYQKLYFTTIDYSTPLPVFPDLFDGSVPQDIGELSAHNVLLITGIASPAQMIGDLQVKLHHVKPLTFADHHQFTPNDVEQINLAFAATPEPRMVITTEKDAARLQELVGLSDNVRSRLLALPITPKFMFEGEENFNEKILSYVQKNSRNSILVKGKDDHKSKDSHNSRHWSRTISFGNNR